MEKLTTDDFIKILTHPRSALIKQYTALLSVENVELEFNKASISAIAKIASEVNSKDGKYRSTSLTHDHVNIA